MMGRGVMGVVVGTSESKSGSGARIRVLRGGREEFVKMWVLGR